MKRLLVAAVALALATTAAVAQGKGARGGGGGAPASPDDRKEQATRRQNEQAYKAALERIPEPKQKYDPWGSVVPAEPTKKPK